jgi:hypothetical protein
VLNVEASAREIHFLLQHKLLQNQRKLRFGFVCFKLVQFSDKEELIGYCKDSCGMIMTLVLSWGPATLSMTRLLTSHTVLSALVLSN